LQRIEVEALDIDAGKVDAINLRHYPIEFKKIEEHLVLATVPSRYV
jgi:UDP-glucose 6-dehydrogenase